ncbi:MAG: tetratricopeptide repeat protein [Nitrospirae bacterium]|nr:tetratricopeptide repeat protein [Nitrospirota bacterium]
MTVCKGGLFAGDERKGLLFGLAVAGVAFIVYANSLGNGFVWDDDVVIVANKALKGGVADLFGSIDVNRASEPNPYYRPLTLLTFLAEQRLHGLLPSIMHFVNILLHAASAFLVCRLAFFIIGNHPAALLAGLLFAVHPVNTESVNLVTARNNLLAGFFSVGSFILYFRGVRRGKYPTAFAGAIFYLAGLFSKETALALLPFIVFFEISRSADAGFQRREAFLRLIPYAACTAFYLVLRNNALSGADVRTAIMPGLAGRLADNVYIIPRYLLTIILPPHLNLRYYLPDDLHIYALQLIAGWLCILISLGWLIIRGRNGAVLFGLLWLTIFYLPVSGIVPIPSAPMADRYLYVPAIGIWIIAADRVYRVLSERAAARRYGVAILILFLSAMAAATVARNNDWKDDITLFSSYVKQYPEQAFGHHNLGTAYLDKAGDPDSARREFEKALALDPFFPRLRTQMGYISMLRNDYDGALAHYAEALAINPFDAEALLNSGTALEKEGRYAEAVVMYSRFLAAPGNELPSARQEAEGKVRELSGLIRK